MRLAAERYAGSGTLQIDCLICIPLDEGFIHIEAESDLINMIGTNPWPIVLAQSASGQLKVIGLNESENPYYSDLTVQLTGGFQNGSDIHRVVAAQRNTAHSLLQDRLAVKFEVYPRWITLRGTA